jgi:hypothetical protein
MSWPSIGPPAVDHSSAAPRLIAMAEWCAVQPDPPAIVWNGVMYRAHAEWLAAGGLGAAES